MDWFPEIFPDELLWGAWARYAEQVGYPRLDDVHADRFGPGRRRVNVELPNALAAFVAQLPPGHGHTVEQLAADHTMYGYYHVGMPAAAAATLLDVMRRDGAGRGRAQAPPHVRVAALRAIGAREHLWYCPACAARDAARPGGAPYWHRVHQLPGVYVCPEHEAPLWASDVPARGPARDLTTLRRRYGGHGSNDILRPGSGAPVCPPEAPAGTLRALARATHAVLRAGPAGISYQTALVGLRRAAARRGLVGAQSRAECDAVEFARAVRDFCGDALLDALGCPIRAAVPSQYWTSHLLYRSVTGRTGGRAGGCVHPIKLLIAGCAMGASPDDLRALGGMTQDDFANLGGVESKAGRVAQYARRFAPLRAELDRRRGGRRVGKRIGDHGTAWDEALRELCADRAVGIENVARILGVATGTVLQRAWDLGCARPTWESARKRAGGAPPSPPAPAPEDASPTGQASGTLRGGGEPAPASGPAPAPRARRQHLRRSLAEHRAVFQAAVEAGMSRMAIAQAHSGSWHALRRKDPQWLELHMPPRRSRAWSAPRVDWLARDAAYVVALEQALDDERRDPFGPRRTRARLTAAAHIAFSAVSTRAERLPDTTRVLAENAESRADFARRRLEAAATELRRELGAPVTPGAIRQRARLGSFSCRDAELRALARQLATDLAYPPG